MIDPHARLGGVASTMPLPPAGSDGSSWKPADVSESYTTTAEGYVEETGLGDEDVQLFINDQVQGGTPSYRNTVKLFSAAGVSRRLTFCFE